MSTLSARLSGLTAVFAAVAVIAVVAPAAAQGSQGEMFRRHFWRGQAYHGAGYPAQVHEMGRAAVPSPDLRASSLEALVE